MSMLLLVSTASYLEIAKDADQETAMAAAMEQERVIAQVDGKDIKKIIYVPGRILNIVAK